MNETLEAVREDLAHDYGCTVEEAIDRLNEAANGNQRSESE